MIGIVKALPQPCIRILAELVLQKSDAARAMQMVMDGGLDDPTPALSAVYVTVKEGSINLRRNWRVPEEFVITRVFELRSHAEPSEDLSWWKTSNGSHLAARPVRVKAKKNGNTVVALLIPQH